MTPPISSPGSIDWRRRPASTADGTPRPRRRPSWAISTGPGSSTWRRSLRDHLRRSAGRGRQKPLHERPAGVTDLPIIAAEVMGPREGRQLDAGATPQGRADRLVLLLPRDAQQRQLSEGAGVIDHLLGLGLLLRPQPVENAHLERGVRAWPDQDH